MIKANQGGKNWQAHNQNGNMYEHQHDKGWEKFKIIPLGGLKVAFKTSHGTYVYAPEPRYTSEYWLNRASLKHGTFREDAVFTLVPQSDGTFGIKQDII